MALCLQLQLARACSTVGVGCAVRLGPAPEKALVAAAPSGPGRDGAVGLVPRGGGMPHRATQGLTGKHQGGQEAEGVGDLWQETLLWFLQKGTVGQGEQA